ncbi:hypothetical protein [Actinoplanes sp. M2I2]|uniref:hypothetical protein n=1 Tax=Actinoplanes sp. M2I2 TaxID=1734444 RepID=UPI00202026AF|nr:hypothetical protein [Actinoplanes sp. M2I2]
MSARCVLAEYLRAGRPGRMPLRSCCVAALVAGGRGCPSRPAGRPTVEERVAVADQPVAS